MIDIHEIFADKDFADELKIKIMVKKKTVMLHIEGFTTEDAALYWATLQTLALEMKELKNSTIH